MTVRPLLDLYPPVRQLNSLFYGVIDGVLTARTPCPDWTVGDLLDHLMGLGSAFTQAARKMTTVAGPPPPPSAAHLHPQWRSRLPVLLEDLVTAWADPLAWTGTTQAGGVTMPAEQMGVVAVNELTLHGWDLARATGQDFAADPRTLLVLESFLTRSRNGAGPTRSRNATGTAAFGAVGEVDDEASLLERVVGLSGRDPYWRPS